jgi:hypothetical protein
MTFGAIAVVDTCRYHPWVLGGTRGERGPTGTEVAVGQGDKSLLDALMRGVESVYDEGPP